MAHAAIIRTTISYIVVQLDYFIAYAINSFVMIKLFLQNLDQSYDMFLLKSVRLAY